MYVFLKRMSYPSRLIDLEVFFGIETSVISRIVSKVLDILYEFRGILHWDHHRLTKETLTMYAEAIVSKKAPLNCVVGFIDGTVRPIARPTRYQRSTYNGHKRVHALKFQSVSAPDGMIIHLSGPYVGRRHDTRMLRESKLSEALSKHMRLGDSTFVIYGDPAYGLENHIISPFRGANLTKPQELFNKRMSRVRVSVEWCFGSVLSNWAFIDFKKNLKVFLQPIGKLYVVAVLLQNFLTCYNGNMCSKSQRSCSFSS
ncbi:hypothetical protein Ae201684P_002225 [Aphanomyces euteiches]|uniref:DDE Tnp4 domain-containing protein n=1 Tax=Aphanomyces euteiches TaxID=100861 RepID=A0A6G0XLE7_9STRA|nr:hypothetical protein Ae201684_003725 [Aphanomyces euteiches]KAH9084993.1 hypothetical protein Ae201684P_002225 [Aphanomyces euteiches]